MVPSPSVRVSGWAANLEALDAGFLDCTLANRLAGDRGRYRRHVQSFGDGRDNPHFRVNPEFPPIQIKCTAQEICAFMTMFSEDLSDDFST
jgi:hypothetical protein